MKSKKKEKDLDIAVLNEKMSNAEMIREEKAGGREAEAGTGDDAPLPLGLDVLHALLPHHLRLNLVLHNLPNPLIIPPAAAEALKHRNRGGVGGGVVDFQSSAGPLDEPRRQAEEELASRDGEGLLDRRRRRGRRRGVVGAGVGGGGEEG